MRILIVNTHDNVGGAAKAAYRLHKALLKIGVDSAMLVQNKTVQDKNISASTGIVNKIRRKIKSSIDKFPLRKYKDRSATMFSTATMFSNEIVNAINTSGADIVHLHWIHEGMLRIEELGKIKKPIVWSLHDMWAFTGGCHYDEECGKYQEGCHNCPVLNSNEYNDLSYKVFQRKQNVYSKIPKMTIIGLSQWMFKSAKTSLLFKQHSVINLPNLIDCFSMKPIEKNIAKNILGKSLEKKLILFGAVGINSDPRKGYKELINTLKLLDKTDIELMIFGDSTNKTELEDQLPVYFTGHLNDDISLRVIYSAADVVIVPSLQENLSNIIMESLACATPVVSFDIGGNSDMIDHRSNGYLAKPFDIHDLAFGIDWVINNESYVDLCKSARNKVLNNFDSELVAMKYKKLYKSVIDNKEIENPESV